MSDFATLCNLWRKWDQWVCIGRDRQRERGKGKKRGLDNEAQFIANHFFRRQLGGGGDEDLEQVHRTASTQIRAGSDGEK